MVVTVAPESVGLLQVTELFVVVVVHDTGDVAATAVFMVIIVMGGELPAAIEVFRRLRRAC